MSLMGFMQSVSSWGFRVVVFGVPIFVSWWTVLLAIYLYWNAKLYIRYQLLHLNRHLNASTDRLLIGALFGTIFMILAATLHEIGHALVALIFGYRITAATLTWWGAYVALPDTFDKGSAWAMVCVAAAGPLMNILISGLCALGVKIIGRESVLQNTFQFLAYMNYRLAKTNLLPIVVFDGGKVVYGLCRLVVGEGRVAFWLLCVITGATIGYILKKGKWKMGRWMPRDRYERMLETL